MEGRIMKRWLTHLAIFSYCAALAIGIVSHTLAVGNAGHPLMYFVVWDMFCGWAGYEGRMEVLAEGESGKFYRLTPGPWGEFQPYGRIGRQHYDAYCTNGYRIGKNCLDHTTHEPMTRIFVVEGEYAKKYNIPDAQYEAYYNKPKNTRTYHHTRFVFTPDGQTLQALPTWLSYAYNMGLRDNPRLMNESRRHRPFLAIGSDGPAPGAIATGTFTEPPFAIPLGAPLAQ
jgi:hypothetical protein